MSRKKRLENLTPICQLVTYALLTAAVLFMLFAGIRLFRRVTDSREEQEHLRATVSYVQNELYMCEEPSKVFLSQGPEGDVLVLPLSDGKYAVKIYLYEGYLREELSAVSDDADPSLAEKITEASSFDVQFSSPTLVKVSVDGREAWAHLGRWSDE